MAYGDLWPTTDVKIERGGNFGLATYPQKLKYGSIKRLLIRALSAQGIRPLLQDGVRRHEVKGTHGYRKFFKTHAENVMKPINVELLMGHDTGISESYWRPTENEVLQDYLKAVDLLTINYDNDKSVLQKQFAELTEKSEEQHYIIKGKLAEKEKDDEEREKKIEQMEKKMRAMEMGIQVLLETGTMDHNIERGASVIGPDTEDMRVMVAERKAKLKQDEIDMLRDCYLFLLKQKVNLELSFHLFRRACAYEFLRKYLKRTLSSFQLCPHISMSMAWEM